MKLLLNTHIFLWLSQQPERIPAPLAIALQANFLELHLSVVSIWEIRTKMRKGKLALADPLEALVRLVVEPDARMLPLTYSHVLHELPDPPVTIDPYDRLLLGQCDVEGLALITVDSELMDHRLAYKP
ncbi:MAG: type II toxin-antitoxin system VapC family toxin [Caulobacterales bacterium]